MSFFGGALGGNPFSTPVGSKIEQATDGTLASENWGLNMEICDLINETEEGPKDAVKAIRKRLQQNAGKNYTVVMYTLIVLETCVKNCEKRFHILVCNKDFVMELVKLIGPKNDPPSAVQEKILSLIQSWADAFRDQPEMVGAVYIYQDLVTKGIEFPPTDLDAMAPIHTPQRSVELEHSLKQEQEPHNFGPKITNPASNVNLGEINSPSESALSVEQRGKIQSELDILQSNMNVFGEMLSEMKPDVEQNPDELELLQELNATCQCMQERLVDLISKLSNDELTADLLRINDDLINLFLRYSRWEKNRENNGICVADRGKSASSILAKATQPVKKSETEASLIDFDDDLSGLSSELSKLSSGPSASTTLSKIESLTPKNTPKKSLQKDDDFDMFAQTRNISYESSKKTTSSFKDNIEPDQISGGLRTATQAKKTTSPELEFDEMADWLGQTTGGEESVTSSEFDRFLAERAAAVEQLPPSNPSSSTNNNNNNNNTSAKEEKNELFAL